MARPVRLHLLDNARHEFSDAAAVLVCAAAPFGGGRCHRGLSDPGGDVAGAVRDHRRIALARISSVELARVCANLGGPLDPRRQHCVFFAFVSAVPAVPSARRGQRVARRSLLLFGGVATFVGLLVALRLPRLWRPIYELEGFEGASIDRYWIAIGLDSRGVDLARTDQELRSMNAVRVLHVAEET